MTTRLWLDATKNIQGVVIIQHADSVGTVSGAPYDEQSVRDTVAELTRLRERLAAVEGDYADERRARDEAERENDRLREQIKTRDKLLQETVAKHGEALNKLAAVEGERDNEAKDKRMAEMRLCDLRDQLEDTEKRLCAVEQKRATDCPCAPSTRGEPDAK